MDDVLSIGRFARLSGLSIGALRHYDELGLLVPAEVDRWTGYRRYRRAQLDRARSIARLRELELPLDEMAAVLDSPDELGRLAALDRHRLRIEARVARGQHVLHHIRGLIDRKEPLMSRPPMPPELDPTTQRQLAAGLYNYTWTLLEQEDRIGRGRRPDDPRRPRLAAPLGRDRAAGQPRPRRVALLAGLRDPRPGRAGRLARPARPGDPRGRRRGDRGLGPAGGLRGARPGPRRGRRAATRPRPGGRGPGRPLAAVADAEDRELIEGDLATLPLG